MLAVSEEEEASSLCASDSSDDEVSVYLRRLFLCSDSVDSRHSMKEKNDQRVTSFKRLKGDIMKICTFWTERRAVDCWI